MSRGRLIVRLVLLTALIAVAATAVGRQRSANARLRRQAQVLRGMGGEAARLREENQRLRAAVTQGDHGETARVVQREIERARQTVAVLERRLEQQDRDAAAGDLAANRDPEKGMVRIEHFRNVGRATPAAAFQTAIWAAVQADFDELAKGLTLSATGRVKAQALIDRQSPETRTRFPTPEKLVAVPFAHDFGDKEGWQIMGTTDEGADRFTLRVRRLQNGIVQGGERMLPVERGTAGWQIVVPDEAIDRIPDYIGSASLRIGRPRKN